MAITSSDSWMSTLAVFDGNTEKLPPGVASESLSLPDYLFGSQGDSLSWGTLFPQWPLTLEQSAAASVPAAQPWGRGSISFKGWEGESP